MKNFKSLTAGFRKDIIKMIYTAQSGHPGGALSIVDILTVLFFGKYIKHNPKCPNDPKRDYFILSKGHACAALYSILAGRGYFDKDELWSFRQVDSLLQGHPSTHIPGIEIATGSLGQGFSVSCGIAAALKQDNKKNKVFCIVGDGELQEGQNYEAMMFANKYCLDNLVVIIDNNGLQIDGKNNEVMPLCDIKAKFLSFCWNVIDLENGHDEKKIQEVFDKAVNIKKHPVAIIAHTIKGKGVSFMEGNYKWHGKAPNKEEYKQAIKELNNIK